MSTAIESEIRLSPDHTASAAWSFGQEDDISIIAITRVEV
jgi:hypothetical protein